VQQVRAAQRRGDLDVDPDRLQRTVRVPQAGRDGVGRRIRARFTEAVDVDPRTRRQRPQGGHQVLDVYSRAAVDVRRPLPRHDAGGR
jgi:hypothetical protein